MRLQSRHGCTQLQRGRGFCDDRAADNRLRSRFYKKSRTSGRPGVFSVSPVQITRGFQVMANSLAAVAEQLQQSTLTKELVEPGNRLSSMVEGASYVGEVFSIGYEEALVQIHDYNRQQVGGIPALSFLLATRIVAGSTPDVRQE